MDATVTWIIIALFYAPLHYLLPLLVVLLTGGENSTNRRHEVRMTLLDCTLSMAIAFTLVIWLARDHIGLAMGLLLASMVTPYVRIWLHRRLHGRQEELTG